MKITKIFESIISIILPKEEYVSEIENLSPEYIENEIGIANETSNPKFKAVFQYKNKIIRKAIWEIKYNGNKKITEKFSRPLYEFIIEELGDEVAFENFNSPLLIPIPSGKDTLKKRGFNQCELIAKELIRLDETKNFQLETKAIFKIKETTHQSETKNKSKRLKNLEGCFSADPQKVRGRYIILIDDVITTGATMKEVSKTLKEAGAKKVIGFSIAH
jgi:competence protein ComFC